MSVNTGRPVASRTSARMASPLGHPDAARGIGGGAVRFVKRALVDQRQGELVSQLREGGGRLQGVGAALNRAGPGDDGERSGVGEAHGALALAEREVLLRGGGGAHGATIPALRAGATGRGAAAMKEAKSGCGAKGREVSSG